MFVACEQVVCYRCQLQVCPLPVLLAADCRLSAAAGDADLPSAAELQQLLLLLRRAAPSWDRSVCTVRRISGRPLLAKPTSERIAAVGPAACAPVFTGVCGKARVQPHVCGRRAGLHLSSFFSAALRSQFTKAARILSPSRRPACVFIAPFLLLSSCQPYLSSSLITPPALLLLSRPSWGAQYDGDGDAPHGVCVCDVTHTTTAL